MDGTGAETTYHPRPILAGDTDWEGIPVLGLTIGIALRILVAAG